jgi:hypothetical protein
VRKGFDCCTKTHRLDRAAGDVDLERSGIRVDAPGIHDPVQIPVLRCLRIDRNDTAEA